MNDITKQLEKKRGYITKAEACADWEVTEMAMEAYHMWPRECHETD